MAKTWTPAELLMCKFHTWQMNDGYWHSSVYTNEGRGVPLSHNDIPGYNTEREARSALREWAERVTSTRAA